MNISGAIQELKTIKGRLSGLLDDQGRRAVDSAIAFMEQQQDEFAKKYGSPKKKGRERPPWRLVIPPGLPLSFRDADLKHRLQVDVSCDLSEPRNGFPRDG